MAGGNEKQAGDSVDFLDIVFTVILTIGVAPEALNGDHFKGVLSEPNVIGLMRPLPDSITPSKPSGQEQTIPGNDVKGVSAEQCQHLSAFLVGLVTLLLSWFGVRASLQNKQIKFDRVWGMFRFILDVAMIVLYGFLLICFRRLDVVLVLLAIIYGLYVIWDICKILEYRGEFFDADEQRKNQIKSFAKAKWVARNRKAGHDLDDWRASEAEINNYALSRPRMARFYDLWATFNRQFVSLLFFLCFFLLCWLWPSDKSWSALLLAAVFTILYRIAKIYPYHGSCTAVLAWGIVLVLSCVFHI